MPGSRGSALYGSLEEPAMANSQPCVPCHEADQFFASEHPASSRFRLVLLRIKCSKVTAQSKVYGTE